VIVPQNQTNGGLNKGYFTIDGTLPTTQEPIYTTFKDYFMDQLQHYALNGVQNSGLQGYDFGKLTNFNNVKGFLKTPVSCWGGTAFDAAKADETYQIIGEFFTDLIDQWNEAVKNQDLVKLGILYPNFWGWLIVARQGYEYKLSEGWNTCTEESIKRMLKVINFFENQVGPLLLGWLKQYFTIEILPQQISFNNQQLEVYHDFYFIYTSNPKTWEGNVRKFTLKPDVKEIKAFEFTPYIEELAKTGNSPVLDKYLSQLTTILLSKMDNPYDVGNSTDPTSDSNGNENGGNKPNTNKDNTLTYVTIGSLLAFGAYKMIK
jgi:hypothetical protein